jgi:hypothetical protein
MKRIAAILLVWCAIGTSSARAIECLSAPNRSESGWWSWREIEGRKCWYIKVGAVPPKSAFTWPEQVTEAPPAKEPAQPETPAQRESPSTPVTAVPRESPSTPATEVKAAASPQVKVAHVKPVPGVPKLRLGDGLIDLMNGVSLSRMQAVGAASAIRPHTPPADSFEARYRGW